MKRLWIWLPSAVLAVALSSCTNPSEPEKPDTANTLWTRVISGADLPDTLYYRQPMAFQLSIGDADGDSVSVTVTGLDPARYSIAWAGDSAILSINNVSDSLTLDTQYTAVVQVSGIDSVDTMTLTYRFVVVDTSNSLWMVRRSAEDLPDTLQYGRSVTYQVCFGDSDGDAAQIAVTGLAPSRYSISRSEDTAYLTLYLAADSLEYDSMYAITIGVRGVGGADTMTIAHRMLVLDTNRIGGMRKLTAGMWWVTEKYDTSVSVKDSTIDSTSTRRIIVSDTSFHRIRHEVKGGLRLQGYDYWQVVSADTSKDDTSVRYDTTYVRHDPASMDVLTSVGGVDTAWVRAYALPLREGASWTTVDKHINTSLTVNWGPWVSPQFIYGMEGTARVDGTVSPLFGGAARKSFYVAGSSESALAGISDTTVDLGYDTVNVGDTLVNWTTTSDSRNRVCPDVGIALWSSNVTITNQRNRLEQVVVNDTTRTSSTVVALYDPRRGAVLMK